MKGAGKIAVYFAALGLGFMFIEVTLMQKFVLFLGHPSYSISVTLAGLLLFSGIGSITAGRLRWNPRRTILLATLGVATATLIYLAMLPPLFKLMIGAPHTMRIVITIVLIAPIGMLMGMPFPTGLAYVRKAALPFVPWAFGINGTFSVVASVLCILIAMAYGFAVVTGLAAATYVAGGIALCTLKIHEPAKDSPPL